MKVCACAKCVLDVRDAGLLAMSYYIIVTREEHSDWEFLARG